MIDPRPAESSTSILGIYHNFVIPLLLGLALTLTKLNADQKDVTRDEVNGISLDLVLLSVGALGAFYMQGRDVAASFSAGVGDAFIAAVLLTIRGTRVRKHAKMVTAGQTVPTVGWFAASVEIVLGLASIIWTVKAF